MNSGRIWVLFSLLIMFFCSLLETCTCRSIGNMEHTHTQSALCCCVVAVRPPSRCAPLCSELLSLMPNCKHRYSHAWLGDMEVLSGQRVSCPPGRLELVIVLKEQCWTEFPETHVCPSLEILEQGWRNPSSQHNNALTARISDNTLFSPSSFVYLSQAAIVRR